MLSTIAESPLYSPRSTRLARILALLLVALECYTFRTRESDQAVLAPFFSTAFSFVFAGTRSDPRT